MTATTTDLRVADLMIIDPIVISVDASIAERPRSCCGVTASPDCRPSISPVASSA